MKNQDVRRQRERLNYLFKQISAIGGDIELQSHWAKYLCVLVAGFLETSIRAIYGYHAQVNASPKVANFVEVRLRRIQNMNMEAILQLTRSFSPEWADQLEKETEGERKDAIDSILANRHLIAHGESVEITYSRIERYYERAVEVLELIENKCLGA